MPVLIVVSALLHLILECAHFGEDHLTFHLLGMLHSIL
jgi:hypothetical protein